MLIRDRGQGIECLEGEVRVEMLARGLEDVALVFIAADHATASSDNMAKSPSPLPLLLSSISKQADHYESRP